MSKQPNHSVSAFIVAPSFHEPPGRSRARASQFPRAPRARGAASRSRSGSSAPAYLRALRTGPEDHVAGSRSIRGAHSTASFHCLLFLVALGAAAILSPLPLAGQSEVVHGISDKAAVVSYEPGTGAAPRFNHPEAALGAPSQFNPFGEPTDPFNPPYGTNQIVSIGADGHLVLQFQTPILNHPLNPEGFDFTLFGNAGFIITNEFDLTIFDWLGTPATDGSLFGTSEGVIVISVSRDGNEFFVLDPGAAPRIDAFPPTDGAGDPGVPIPSGLSAADFSGATLATIRELYRGSAGGASFDLDTALDQRGQKIFLPEINFIRVDVLTGRAEVDAIVAVDHVPPGRP
jgi:hypothetical protein